MRYLGYFLLLALLPIAYYMLEDDKQPTGPSVNEEGPELNLPDSTGHELSLSELQGNYVLVTFWASWCTPCRQKNPEYVSLYQEFGNESFSDAEGFEIYSISLDRDRNAWLNAIHSDNLAWQYHVSELNRWETDATEKYGVTSIPDALLLGPDGKVVTKTADKQELRQVLAERAESI